MRSYGIYCCGPGAIGLKLEPAAALRFKRVFERAEKRPAEWIMLKATPENAREVEWFAQRFPIDPASSDDADRLDALARQFDRSMAAVERIMAPNYKPPKIKLALPARDYQLLPAAMLAATGGVLVGDEVGLGKTVESIVALAQEGALPGLIVTLTHLPRQFEREIKRFAPQLSTYVMKRTSPIRRTDTGTYNQDLALHIERTGKRPDVVVMSYSKLAGWAEWLALHFKPKTIVWDEVQEARTGPRKGSGPSATGSVKCTAMMYLAERTERRMGLSATPIYNKGAEIHPVMDVILPGALGSREEFIREWCVGGLVTDPQTLGNYMRDRGLLIRRTKADVGRELPPVTIAEQYCDADPKIIEKLARSSRAIDLAKFVLSGKREAFQASGEFDMLIRQQTGVAKAPFVGAFVDLLTQSDEPVVLYGWHHQVYDLWREQLAHLKPAFFTGKESETQKTESVRRFCEGETKLFIISLRAGAGLDGLQYAGCSNVVFGELDWSPAVHEQAIGRVSRDGIDRPVTGWFMVSEEGSDPVMAEVLGVKRGQLEGIRNPAGGVVTGHVDPDALKRLATKFLHDRGVKYRGAA